MQKLLEHTYEQTVALQAAVELVELMEQLLKHDSFAQKLHAMTWQEWQPFDHCC